MESKSRLVSKVGALKAEGRTPSQLGIWHDFALSAMYSDALPPLGHRK
jgi:hypothetical protein